MYYVYDVCCMLYVYDEAYMTNTGTLCVGLSVKKVE